MSSALPLLPVNRSAAAARCNRSPAGASTLRVAGPSFSPSSQNTIRTPFGGVENASNPSLRASAMCIIPRCGGLLGAQNGRRKGVSCDGRVKAGHTAPQPGEPIGVPRRRQCGHRSAAPIFPGTSGWVIGLAPMPGQSPDGVGQRPTTAARTSDFLPLIASCGTTAISAGKRTNLLARTLEKRRSVVPALTFCCACSTGLPWRSHFVGRIKGY